MLQTLRPAEAEAKGSCSWFSGDAASLATELALFDTGYGYGLNSMNVLATTGSQNIVLPLSQMSV